MRIIHVTIAALACSLASPTLAAGGVVACQSSTNRPGGAEKITFHNLTAGDASDVSELSGAYLQWLMNAPAANAALGKNGLDPRIARLDVRCAWYADQQVALAAVKDAQVAANGRGFFNINTDWTPSTDPATPGYVICMAKADAQKQYFTNVFTRTTRAQKSHLATAYPVWLRANGPTAALLRSDAAAPAPSLATSCEFYEFVSSAGGRAMDTAREQRQQGFTATATYWDGTAAPAPAVP